MIRKIFVMAFAVLSFNAFAVDADSIVGTWLTADKEGNRDSVVEVYKAGDKYNGRVVWLRNDTYAADHKMAGLPITDLANPDESLRARPILGMDVVTDLEFDDDEWEDGEIYAAREGKTYSSKAWFEDGNMDKLFVRGYIGMAFAGQTVEWTRSSVPPTE